MGDKTFAVMGGVTSEQMTFTEALSLCVLFGKWRGRNLRPRMAFVVRHQPGALKIAAERVPDRGHGQNRTELVNARASKWLQLLQRYAWSFVLHSSILQ